MKTVKIRADLWRLTPMWAVAGTRGSFGLCSLCLDLSGTASYVIDGVSESGEAIVSVRGELRVIDTAEPGGNGSLERTPSEAEQIRAELAALRRELRELKEVRNGIKIF